MDSTTDMTPSYEGLWRRLGIVTLAIVLSAGIALSAVRQRNARTAEETAATAHAQLVTDSILAPALTPEDLAAPLRGDQYQKLATIVDTRVLNAQVIGVTIVAPDGTVVFSHDPSLIGQKLTEQQSLLEPVLAGTTQAAVTQQLGGSESRYVTFVPLRLREGGPVDGVVEVSDDYSKILAKAARPWRTMEVGFAVALLLCLISTPLVWRAPKKAAERERVVQAEAAEVALAEDGGTALRRANEHARQAEAAYRTVSDQLQQSQNRLREAEAAQRALAEQAQQAEGRARSGEHQVRSFEAALRTARERLGELEERLNAVGPGPVVSSDAAREAAAAPETAERLRQTEEQLRLTEDRLREAEEVKRYIAEQARHAEERATQAEQRAAAVEAENATLAQPIPHGKPQGKQAGRISERLAEANAERERLEGEFAQMREELREANERAQLSETAYQSVAEELKAMHGGADLEGRLKQAEQQVALADQATALAEQRARAAEERARLAEEQVRAVQQQTRFTEEQTQEREALLAHTESKRAALQERLRQASGQPTEGEERVHRAEERARDAEEKARVLEARLASLNGAVPAGEPVIIHDDRGGLQAALAGEIRGPLTSILGLTLSLKHADPASPEARDMVRQLSTNAKKLDRLIADLLDVDRLASGTLVPTRRRTDLEALVRRVVDEVKHLSDRNVTVQSEPAVAAVDPARAEQMIDALLANASRRTSPGASIWVRVGAEQDGVLISVDDDGADVPEELRRAILQGLQDDPDGAAPHPRAGTGLSFLERLAEIHGGRAWVEERPGGGASFRVFLPDAPIEIGEADQEDRGVAAPASPG